MKIECKLQRNGGSYIEIDGVEYHFAPQPDGAHVAEVTREDHQDRFLAIPEGYRLYRPGKAAEESAASVKETVIALLGSSVHPASFDIGGKTYQLGEVVALAAQGFEPADWNELSDDARADLIDEQLDQLAANPPEEKPAGDDLESLKAQYLEKFGSKPHHKWSAETIKAKLAEQAE